MESKKKQLENFVDSELSQMREEGKKITKGESDQIYARMMEKQRVREEQVMKKRAMLKLKKKQEELEAMKTDRCRRIQ